MIDEISVFFGSSPLMVAAYTLLAALIAGRVVDGVEHGLHWASKPRLHGARFHGADFVDVALHRLLLLTGIALLHHEQGAPAWQTAAAWIALCYHVQAIWQMALNHIANGGMLREPSIPVHFRLLGAEWTTEKLFRGPRRLIQLALSLAVLIFTL